MINSSIYIYPLNGRISLDCNGLNPPVNFTVYNVLNYLRSCTMYNLLSKKVFSSKRVEVVLFKERRNLIYVKALSVKPSYFGDVKFSVQHPANSFLDVPVESYVVDGVVMSGQTFDDNPKVVFVHKNVQRVKQPSKVRYRDVTSVFRNLKKKSFEPCFTFSRVIFMF